MVTDAVRSHESSEAPSGGAVQDIEEMISAWRSELDGLSSVSASRVQDRLLDLWGRLPEGDIRADIERWLTETLERSLYAASDVEARLEQVLADA